MSKRKRNIVFFHPDLGIGGAERLVIDAAVGLQNRGHTVTIFTSHRDPAHCFDEARDGSLDVRIRGHTLVPPSLLSRLTILCATLRHLHLLLTISVFSTELAALRPDVFFVDQLAAGIPVLRYLWPEVRVLFYCHFPDFLLVKGREEAWGRGLVKRVWRVPFDAVEGWGVRGADRVVVNSSFTRGVVGGVWPGLVEGKGVRVVYPCVNTRGRMGDGEEGEGKGEGVWRGKKVVLSINRFERKKDVGLAVRAFAGLGEAGRRGVRLVVAGGYDNRIHENVAYHNELVKLAESLGLHCATTKNVVTALNVPDAIEVLFLLSVPASLKSMLLNAASLLVYTPSQEHFGIVPLEAMLAGVPVLAANSGGPLETVVDGQTGWLRPADDVGQWTEVLENVLHQLSDEQLREMGEAGRRRVRAEFSESRMAQRLEEEIDGMVEAPRSAAVGIQDLLLGLGVGGMVLALRFPGAQRPGKFTIPMMPSPEIIDLSLETDEEEIPPTRPLASGKPSKNVPDTNLRFIGDGDARPHADHSTEGPRKRRKLSPALVSDDDVKIVKGYIHNTGRMEVKKGGSTFFQASAEATARQWTEKQKSAGSKTIGTGTSVAGWHEISDPILCTSSPHPDAVVPRSRRRAAREPSVSSDDGLVDIADLRGGRRTLASIRGLQLSARTEALLSSLSAGTDVNTKLDSSRHRTFESHIAGLKKGKVGLQMRKEHSPLEEVAEGTVNVKKKKMTEDEKKARDVEKEYNKVQRAERKRQEREEEKERKRLLKEEKAREKKMAADLAEVNKVRTDKKVSTPEMIVDLPLSIEGESVDIQIREFLKNLQVEVTTYSNPVPNVVKWRRKVTAQFNEELDYWEPIPQEIRQECHVLCLLSAKDFVDMANINSAEVDGQDLEAHVLKLKSRYDESTPIYLIEGLEAWMRKNKNVRNRAYQAAVLSQTDGLEAGAQTTVSSKRKKPAAQYIDEDMVEDALLRLQVMHGCLIHHTAAPVETAEWVANFTQHISTIPYRQQRMNMDTSFCIDVGQVKTGDDKEDTFVKMLQEIVRVTAPIAYGIAAQYPTVVDLVQGFRSKGPTALEDLKKCANKNGALSDARIGPALSRRLHKVFMGTDPGSNDV